MAWSSFPSRHKQACLQAVILWALAVVAVAMWLWVQIDKTLQNWDERIPHVSAEVKIVFAPPSDLAGLPAASGGYISLIMTDLGLSDELTERAINELPAEIALAFSPYSRSIKTWLDKASNAQRQTLVLLPMEPVTYPKDDPGPLALLTRLSEKDNATHFAQVLDRAAGVIGMMNFMGSLFMSDESLLTPVFTTLQQQGRFFVATPAVARTKADVLAESIGLPYINADMHVDINAAEPAIQKRLITLEETAAKNGFAIGIIHPYPVTFGAIAQWAGTLEKRGIRLVLLTTALGIKEQNDKKESEQPALAP